MRELIIDSRLISDDTPPLVISELSHNHCGSLPIALEMVRASAEAGASGIKLQRRTGATYCGLRAVGEGAYADLREQRELSVDDYRALKAEAHRLGLAFIVTGFDQQAVDELVEVGVDALKLASGDITNLPLIEHCATLGMPLILSTGGCQFADVRRAHGALTAAGVPFALLHCTSEYPVEVEHVNLRLIDTYRRAFPDTVIGFSSHVARDAGPALEAAAFALGARIFEKHFTLTPDIGTGEHAFALTQRGLYDLAATLARTRAALGDGQKRIMPGEEMGILRLGKHLAYARAGLERATLTARDFAVVGGGRGLLPYHLAELVGGRLTRPVQAGEDVQEGDILQERGEELVWPHEFAT